MQKFARFEMALAVSGLFFLNLFDAVATLIGISLGGVEMNPAMAWFLEQGWWVFLGAKAFLGACACLSMWHGREREWVTKGVVACLGLYSAVANYHIALLSSITVAALLS